MRHALCRQIVTITGAMVLVVLVAGMAQAATLAAPAQRRAMLQSGVGRLNGKPAGFVKWAVVSSSGPYAVASVVGRRRYRREFQDGLAMLHRTGGRWHFVAIIEDESCPSVPTKVFADLSHWFRGPPGARLVGRRPAIGIAGLLSPRHPCAPIANG